MLIVLGKRKNNNGTTTKMNLTGVAAPHITGTTLIDTADDVHTHTDFIDHVITTPSNYNKLNSLIVHADTNRLG